MNIIEKTKRTKVKLYILRDFDGKILDITNNPVSRTEYEYDGIKYRSREDYDKNGPYSIGLYDHKVWQNTKKIDIKCIEDGYEERFNDFIFEANVEIGIGSNGGMHYDSIQLIDLDESDNCDYYLKTSSFVKCINLARNNKCGFKVTGEFSFLGKFKFNCKTNHLTIEPVFEEEEKDSDD